MIISDSGSGFEQLEEGLHPAVAVLIAGVGTQRTPFKNEDGTDKVQKKMIVQWDTAKGMISKEYTISLNEKANLRKDLESWRGKKFSDIELQGFDMKNLIGKECTVQVMHNDNGYAVVTAVLPKTGTYSTIKIPFIYDFEAHSDDLFDRLPAWIQKKVNTSIERMEKVGGRYDLHSIPATDDLVPLSDEDAPIDMNDVPF